MKLSEYLKENDLTQEGFAQFIDYSLPHIHAVVNGRRPSRKLARIIQMATKGKVTCKELRQID